MALYKVMVETGSFLLAGTFDNISITLVGLQEVGAKSKLDNFGRDFLPGATDLYHINEKQDLGKIELIRLHKEPFLFFSENNWFCSQVTVESPTGKIYHFPCYRWIEGYLTVELPEGTATLASAEVHNPLLRGWRENELKERRETYKWKVYHKDFPRCIDVGNVTELDSNVKYSITKSLNFALTQETSTLEIKLEGFFGRQESWKSLEDLKRVLWTHKTATSEYVSHHWREDAFFGYQFLNGVDPMMIKKCNKIPDNFPVTDSMVAYILGPKTNLTAELQSTAIGVAGLAELISRDMQAMTYTSICITDNLKSREVESVPNFYYRDDGLKIWSAIESYVSGIVDCYYKSDESIQTDPELQAWVGEIFKEGFLERKSSGVPSLLQTRPELIKYLTMVIFTSSAQHAAVNSGQFDFLAWMPNGPSTMRQPPPKTKGTATLESVLEILPAVGTTASMMVAVRLLSKEPGDMRPLGTFPDEHFTEEEPKRCIKAFQERLSQISAEIESRNASLPLKYDYLNPKVIENSVSI
ncbi:hydroperoxide isomerase ALOXE3-like isoform X4 [Lissotriton helveticus]